LSSSNRSAVALACAGSPHAARIPCCARVVRGFGPRARRPIKKPPDGTGRLLYWVGRRLPNRKLAIL
jgi:hypothetical protein